MSNTGLLPGRGRRPPQIVTVIDIPTRPDKIKTDRVFNKLLKEALQFAGEQHIKRVIPGHFNATARNKYGHKPRSRRYKARKLKTMRSRTDLVFTGKSKRFLTKLANWTIRKGGTAAKGTAKITLTARLPFAGGTGKQKATNKRKGVTPADMVQEIQATTNAERKNIAKTVAQRFMRLVENFKAPRRKKRIKGK